MLFESLMEFDLPFKLLLQNFMYFRTQDLCYSVLQCTIWLASH